MFTFGSAVIIIIFPAIGKLTMTTFSLLEEEYFTRPKLESNFFLEATLDANS